MKQGRELASVTIWNEYICIAGGLTNNSLSPAFASVELYDPKLNEWTQMPPIDIPSTEHVITEWDGFLYATGRAGSINIIKKFDLLKKNWTSVSDFEIWE